MCACVFTPQDSCNILTHLFCRNYIYMTVCEHVGTCACIKLPSYQPRRLFKTTHRNNRHACPCADWYAAEHTRVLHKAPALHRWLLHALRTSRCRHRFEVYAWMKVCTCSRICGCVALSVRMGLYICFCDCSCAHDGNPVSARTGECWGF